MNTEAFQRLTDAFEQALELDADDREAFAAAAFPDDRGLQSELRSMLACAEPEPDFLEPPTSFTAAGARSMPRFESTLGPGSRVGEFELVRPIGSGFRSRRGVMTRSRSSTISRDDLPRLRSSAIRL